MFEIARSRCLRRRETDYWRKGSKRRTWIRRERLSENENEQRRRSEKRNELERENEKRNVRGRGNENERRNVNGRRRDNEKGNANVNV